MGWGIQSEKRQKLYDPFRKKAFRDLGYFDGRWLRPLLVHLLILSLSSVLVLPPVEGADAPQGLIQEHAFSGLAPGPIGAGF